MDVVQCRLERWRTPGGPRCAEGGTSHRRNLGRSQPTVTTAHRQKTALITGASSGIGYELTQLFARDGYDLVLLARSQARLAQVADDLQHRYGVAVRVLAYDLAQPTAPTQIVAQLQQEDLAIEALVNNAGFATYGPFVATDLATELEMIQVNVVALTQLTKLLLPGMLQRRSGRILNVASTAAFQPGPLTAVYSATKAYVLSFSEALANEVRGSGVRVTALCPGPTRSGFQRRAPTGGSPPHPWGVLEGG